MKSLGRPLTVEDKEKLHKHLHDENLFERMVERAVGGMRKAWRRARRAC